LTAESGLEPVETAPAVTPVVGAATTPATRLPVAVVVAHHPNCPASTEGEKRVLEVATYFANLSTTGVTSEPTDELAFTVLVP